MLSNNLFPTLFPRFSLKFTLFIFALMNIRRFLFSFLNYELYVFAESDFSYELKAKIVLSKIWTFVLSVISNVYFFV